MADNGFYEYISKELFADIEGITSRSMFGGYGFYKDGLIFAIIADGKLYFKVGDSNRKMFEEYGSSPFVYEAKGKPMTMSYYELPEQIMEDRDALPVWIDAAVEITREGRN